jgi:O-methyltransferase
MSQPVSAEEIKLREQAASGRATLSDLLRLHALLSERGESLPLDWEERALRLALSEEPNRQDLRARLRQVLILRGHDIPADLSVTSFGPTPPDILDYQAEMLKYHARAGMADMDQDFLSLYNKCRGFTMTSPERMYGLYKAVEYVVRANVPGAIVECGVWRGGSMMVVAETLLAIGHADRILYLFDTFDGLPRPDALLDVDIWGNRGIDGWVPHAKTQESSTWALATLEEVAANLTTTGYPSERLRFVRGMVEKTIPDNAPDDIALLRLDTDWYRSTRHELEHLYPRLSCNGVLIIDDYGHFMGARKAVDEYLSAHGIAILLNRLDYSGRIAVKIS